MLKPYRTALLPILVLLCAAAAPETSRWSTTASRVTITRDDWGIAHIHGRSDADAVFGELQSELKQRGALAE